jgi:hypothetical protein
MLLQVALIEVTHDSVEVIHADILNLDFRFYRAFFVQNAVEFLLDSGGFGLQLCVIEFMVSWES